LSAQRKQELAGHLMLFYTGIRRTASDVAASYAADLQQRQGQLHYLSELVAEGLSILSGHGDLCDFGKLLHAAWLAKASLSDKVTNATVNAIYDDALAAGALGGKLLGAGGGGFMLLFVRPEDQPRVLARLAGLVHVPFEFHGQGSQIIFVDAERDYHAEERRREASQPLAFQELTEMAA
jgi:D-glycero-alpha-D-manno-heptose-7-phosphate kinase